MLFNKDLFLLTLTTWLMCFTAKSQSNWFPDDAVWINIYGTTSSSGYTKIKVTGDTILNGLACKKLVSATIQQYITDPLIHYSLNDNYVLQSNQVVYIFNTDQQQFDTLYNFNVLAGDQLSFYSELYPDGYQEVTGIGQTTINNQELKWIAVKYHNINWPDGAIDTLIEKIGSTLFNVLLINIGYQFEWETLCNYSDNLIGLYSPKDMNCDSLYNAFLISEIREITNEGALKIFPNPVQDLLQLMISNQFTEQVEQVEIFDVYSRSVMKLEKISSFINITTLHSGIYLLELKTHNQTLKAKFLKN
ncbi:MAG: T9SS type A sorting domain-containing protein [Chitinophagales bacterium]